jgi:hypothetical protein
MGANQYQPFAFSGAGGGGGRRLTSIGEAQPERPGLTEKDIDERVRIPFHSADRPSGVLTIPGIKLPRYPELWKRRLRVGWLRRRRNGKRNNRRGCKPIWRLELPLLKQRRADGLGRPRRI